MDERLRILKRLSVSDPEAKESYIAALERTVGTRSAEPKSLTDICNNLHGMVSGLVEVLQTEGTHIYLWQHEGGPNAVYFLVEEETTVGASGLCLAGSTRQVSSAFIRHYSFEDVKTWSAEPLIFLEDGEAIFTWSIERLNDLYSHGV